MSGTLYIVATPIGNLNDVTLRAIDILSDVDIVLAEDTRVTKKLIDYIFFTKEIEASKMPQLLSYHQHSSEERKLEILKNLMDGKKLALVTDAGTPGVSDPGNELVDFVLSNDKAVKVIPIPGASAITTALSVCGFNVNKFIFLGFWPKKKVTKQVETLKAAKLPYVFYESPFRIIKTLGTIKDSFGPDTRVFVGRELTKVYESLYRGTVTEVLDNLSKDTVKGEIVVIVEN